MKNMLVIAPFMLATLAWAVAQQPGSVPERSSAQATSPSSQAPGANQSQPSTPGSADQAGAKGQAANAPVTEGCLGGSDPNYTITDEANVTYKLNIPPNTDTSKLTPHVGESSLPAAADPCQPQPKRTLELLKTAAAVAPPAESKAEPTTPPVISPPV